MKKFLPIAFALIAGSLLYSVAPAASIAQSDLQNRVAELEEALAEEKKNNAALEQSIVQIQNYLEKQAASAKAMQRALDKAEDEGFAKGINFQSRLTLLEGWRSALDAAQKDVPKKMTAPPAGETARIRGRRSKNR